jgi:hypothetical protein
VYEGHSHSIIDTLEGLLEKAQAQLADSRKSQIFELHNFGLLEQSLKDQIQFMDGHLECYKRDSPPPATRKPLRKATRQRARRNDSNALRDVKRDFVIRSQDVEAATKSRADELTASFIAASPPPIPHLE